MKLRYGKMQYWALKLTVVCVAMFILQLLYPIVTDSLVLVSADVLARPWTLLSHVFLHGSGEHLLYNMFALALFGTILEKIVGGKRFLILFFAAGMFSAIGDVAFYTATLGASGAVMGIIGCLAVLRPKMTVWLFYIPMPMMFAAVIWALGDLIGMFIPSNVANAAHLFGLGFGVGLGFYLRYKYGERFFKKRTHDIDVSEEELNEWEEDWM